MQRFVWHKDQKPVCHCLAAILSMANNSNQDASWLNEPVSSLRALSVNIRSRELEYQARWMA